MKIAFLVWRFPVLSETFILNQIAGLIDRGHDVRIYSFFRKPDDLSQVHPIVEQYNLWSRTIYPNIPSNYFARPLKAVPLIARNVRRGSLKCLSLLNILKYGKSAYSLKWLYVALALLEREQYDIIHAQFGTLGNAALIFRDLDLLQGRLVTAFRGIDISQYVKTKGSRVYDRLFEEGNLFLPNCDFLKQKAIDLGCDRQKIVIHASGIDCDKFAFSARSFPSNRLIKIATTGRLIEKKGIEYSIRAIAQLKTIYPNVEYDIIGDGPLEKNFQQLIQALDLNSTVKLWGRKKQDEIVTILARCHIFVAPSVTATDGNQEGVTNTLKEAMAMGLIAIGTFHGGIPELIEDGRSGFLVPERDADAIAQKLNFIIQHPEIWHQISLAGRKQVEQKYDTNKLNDELVKIYQTLI